MAKKAQGGSLVGLIRTAGWRLPILGLEAQLDQTIETGLDLLGKCNCPHSPMLSSAKLAKGQRFVLNVKVRERFYDERKSETDFSILHFQQLGVFLWGKGRQ